MTFPFNSHHRCYEAWFSRHKAAYLAGLFAGRPLLPWEGIGLEIGVGTGRFTAPLGIHVGVQGIAETLPFKNALFDFALVVTTICFVDNPKAMLTEARRVLKPGAPLVIGFVDRDSALDQYYLDHKAENVFYRGATFYSASEVEMLLRDMGFVDQSWGQTVAKPLNEIQEIEPFRAGHGQGAFVVVRAARV